MSLFVRADARRAAIAVIVAALCPLLTAQNRPSPGYYLVANTRAPDAYLALRTEPSADRGQRIATMPNGTLLEVLQRRPDGWWLVRIAATGQEGWALSGQGDRTWILCCQMAQSLPQGGDTARIYSPETGTAERTAILDTARAALGTSVRFKVDYLAVVSNGNVSLAVADLSDAAGKEPPAGLMFFEAI